MASKAIKCDLCDVRLSSEALLAAHNEGKKHQKKVEKRNALEALAQRSVYVCGVPKHTLNSSDEVEFVFGRFGTVDRVHIDATKGSFAIIEFEKQEFANAAIQQGSIQIGEHCAVIKPRKVDFDSSHEKYEKETVDVDAVIDELASNNFSFTDGIDCLIRLYCLSNEQINERHKYGEELTDALRQYFTSEISVRVFGSSITSVGTADSDIDATVVFGDNSLELKTLFSPMDRDKFTLMTCATDTFRARRVQRAEVMRLTPSDRVRFVAKILNDIRRHNLAPISDLFLILDARCPLLRFLYKRECTIDLSVDNRLGVAKSSWIAEIIKSDSSTTLRRFFIAIRFWSVAHELMRKDNTMHSHFNAYILNLLCVSFLEAHSILPPLQRGAQPVKAGGWDVDFSVDSHDFQHLQIASLIKDFFTWFVTLKLKDHVLCPRLGSLLTAEEFNEAYPRMSIEGFKFGYLNVQDPLQLSHNVSQLVSEKNVSAMRRAMLLSLSSMKRKPESFVAAFRFSPPDLKNESDLRLTLPAKGRTCGDCAEEITKILSELLAFQPVTEPKTKRARLHSDDSTTMDYEVAHRVWSGRRNKRRIIAKENPSLDSWGLEELVSKAIAEDNGGGGDTPCLLLRLIYQVDGERVTMHLQRLSGAEVDVHNLGHFLSQFLPKYFTGIQQQRGDQAMET